MGRRGGEGKGREVDGKPGGDARAKGERDQTRCRRRSDSERDDEDHGGRVGSRSPIGYATVESCSTYVTDLHTVPPSRDGIRRLKIHTRDRQADILGAAGPLGGGREGERERAASLQLLPRPGMPCPVRTHKSSRDG